MNPTSSPGSRPPRVATGWRLVGAVLGVYTAVFGVFLLPLTPVPHVSVGLVLTLGANYVLARVFRRLGEGTPGALLPAVAWLATALFLGLGRTEGDIALLVDWRSFGLIVLGAAAAALGIAEAPRATGEHGSRDTAERR